MSTLADYPKPDAEPEVAEPNWEVGPCGVTRKSDPLTCANFDALCDRLDAVDPYGVNWEILRFPHFSTGWLEQIFVRPGSALATMCADVREQLARYPCLDEDKWVQYDEEANLPKTSDNA